MPIDKKYYDNLSFRSNDKNVATRDEAGNLINEIPLVFIDPVTWQYDTTEFNSVIETRFSYFKFTPQLVITDLVELTDADLTIDQEYISRYKIQPGFDIPYLLTQQEALQLIKSGKSDRFIIKDGVITTDSLIEGSFKPIEFYKTIQGYPQSDPGKFTITSDILELKTDLQLTVNVGIKFLDNHGQNNFIVRLLKYNETGKYIDLAHVSSISNNNDTVVKLKTFYNGELRKYENSRKNLKNEIENGPSLKYSPKKMKELSDHLDEVNATYDSIKNLIANLDLNGTIYTPYNDILTGKAGYLYPTADGSPTILKLDYIIKKENLKLFDSYVIELIAPKYIDYPPEIIDDVTFWDIQSI